MLSSNCSAITTTIIINITYQFIVGSYSIAFYTPVVRLKIA